MQSNHIFRAIWWIYPVFKLDLFSPMSGSGTLCVNRRSRNIAPDVRKCVTSRTVRSRHLQQNFCYIIKPQIFVYWQFYTKYIYWSPEKLVRNGLIFCAMSLDLRWVAAWWSCKAASGWAVPGSIWHSRSNIEDTASSSSWKPRHRADLRSLFNSWQQQKNLTM